MNTSHSTTTGENKGAYLRFEGSVTGFLTPQRHSLYTVSMLKRGTIYDTRTAPRAYLATTMVRTLQPFPVRSNRHSWLGPLSASRSPTLPSPSLSPKLTLGHSEPSSLTRSCSSLPAVDVVDVSVARVAEGDAIATLDSESCVGARWLDAGAFGLGLGVGWGPWLARARRSRSVR